MSIHAIDFLRGEELPSDEVFYNFTDAEYDLIYLVIGEHHDERFLEVETDHFTEGFVFFEQNGEEVQKGVFYLPCHLLVLSGEGSVSLKHFFYHFYQILLFLAAEGPETDRKDLSRNHSDQNDALVGLVICKSVQRKQIDIFVYDVVN